MRPGRGKVTESATYGRHAGLPRKAGSSGRRGFLLFSPTQSRPGAPLRRSGVSKRAVVIFWGLSAPNSAIATRDGRGASRGVPTLPT
jgi:hypothetical protein